MSPTRRDLLLAGAASLAIGSRAAAARPMPLETVAELPVPPGNISVTAEGRVVVSAHPFFPSPASAWIIDPGAEPRPVLIREQDGALVRVLSVRADVGESVWMMNGGGARRRLYRVDARTGRVAGSIAPSTEGLVASSALNDIAIDRGRGLLYLTDPAADGAALVVMSATTGRTRRVLHDHLSVRRDDAVRFVIDGRAVGDPQPGGGFRALGGGANPITIDPDERWVYFAAMSSRSLWRIAATDLADEALDPAALTERVELVGEKHASAGITVDMGGTVYVSDPGARGVGAVALGKAYRLVAQDKTRLDFADGLATGDDGFVYVCANGLYRRSVSHKSTADGGPPFAVTRFRALAPTRSGR